MAGRTGRSGRPRLSAEEHQLRGTYRPDRQGVVPASDRGAPGEAVPTEADAPAVGPPRDLTAAERAQWAYYAPLLASARLLSPADRETLADYCRACVAVIDRSRRLATALKAPARALDLSRVRVLDTQVRGWMDCKIRLAAALRLTAVARMHAGWTGHAQGPAPAPAVERPPSKLAELQARALTLRRGPRPA